METNNKLRNALEQIANICDGADIGGLTERIAIYNIAKAALAEPVRNCDMGTLTEQQQRFRDFCEEMQHTDKACCGGCPIVHLRVEGVISTSCELAWAQMPYRERGVK